MSAAGRARIAAAARARWTKVHAAKGGGAAPPKKNAVQDVRRRASQNRYGSKIALGESQRSWQIQTLI